MEQPIKLYDLDGSAVPAACGSGSGNLAARSFIQRTAIERLIFKIRPTARPLLHS
jgi:hypothetical protein